MKPQTSERLSEPRRSRGDENQNLGESETPDVVANSCERASSRLGLRHLLAALVLASIPAVAQPFVLETFTVGGGGGTSSGGNFTVSGTIGQADAGQSAGGNFTVGGGFWAVVSEIVVPGSPELTVRLLSNGALEICWPSAATGWALQDTATLGTPAWGPSTLEVQDDGTRQCVTVPAPVGERFFRLLRP